MNKQIIPTTPDQEIVTTRVVNAPMNMAWQAWTHPQYLKQWWGPNGFTNTFHQHELRIGGTWKFTMHGPEKGNYENECVFIQIDPPHLIAWDRISRPYFQVLTTFEELTPSTTRIVFKQLFLTAEECNKLRPYVLDKNEENFDRLEKVLKTML